MPEVIEYELDHQSKGKISQYYLQDKNEVLDEESISVLELKNG